MEQKRLIAVGVEGPAIQATDTAQWIPAGPGHGALLFGVGVRDESDAEEALRFACSRISPQHRLIVQEIEVGIEDGKIQFDWHKAFGVALPKLEPGEILVSPAIAKIYHRLFLFEKVEENDGDLFYLRGTRNRPTRLRGLKDIHAPMVGRDKEVTRLDELLDQVTEDQGQIAGFVAEAGMGKTRLLVVLKELAQKRSIPCIEGVHPPTGGEPYHGFRRIVIGLVGGKIETLSRWEMTDAETDFLRLFLEPNAKIDRLAGLSDEQIRQGLFFSVRKLIHSAARAPLVLILEDLHWADKNTIELLEYILEDIESTRLLLVLAHRPDLEITWSGRLNYNELRLKPLPKDEIDRFTKIVLNVDRLASQALNQLTRLSLGNPLFVEEMIRHLVDIGTLEIETDDDGKRYLLLKDQAASIPTTIHALIASRFDRLNPEPREVLRWASLFGSEADTDELETLLTEQLGKSPVEAVKELFQRKYFVEKSVFPTRRHLFGHDLVFEVVLNSLSEPEKKKRNAIIGKFIEKKGNRYDAERIADHLIQGDDPLAAMKAAIKAGEMSLEFYRFPQAADYLREAAKRWESGSKTGVEPAQLYAPMIQALLTIGETDEAGQALEKWKQSGVHRDASTQGRYARLSMMYHLAKSEYNEALQASDMALKAFSLDPNLENERYETIPDRMNILVLLGRIHDVDIEATKILHELGDRYPLVRLRLWARIAYCASITGDQAKAWELIQKAMTLVTPETPPQIQVELFKRMGRELGTMGYYQEAISSYSKAVQLAESTGLKREAIHVSVARTTWKMAIGDYEGSLDDVRSALHEARLMKNSLLEANYIQELILILLSIGAIGEAEEMFNLPVLKLINKLDPAIQADHAEDHANLFMYKGDFLSAQQFRKKNIDIYREVGNASFVERGMLMSFWTESEGALRAVNQLVNEFDQFVIKRGGEVEKSRWVHWYEIVSYSLAAHGGTPSFMPDERSDPISIKHVYHCQLSSTAKIKWLDAIGEKEKAKTLREKYQKKRAELVTKVPKKHQEEFLRHPIFRVPL